jgi:serine/threonine protein kinase
MECPACGAALPPVADPTQRSVDCPSCGHAIDLRAVAEPTQVVRPGAESDPWIGRTVGGGRYRIDAPLGRGGMGAVYRGTQISLGRPVAIKLLSPDLSGDETFLRRFRREAGVLAALQHRNVVTIHDTGDEEGLPYIVMAYVAGPDGEPLSLRRVLDAGPLDPDLALRLASEIGAGLAFAHERGIVHRDVKPANVLLDESWHAQVADFGIAHARLGASRDPTLTVPGSSLGTWKYMAPEQWIDAARVDARSDV